MKILLAILTLVSFLITGTIGPMPAYAVDEFHLPAPGLMVHLSPDFNPPILKGIKVDPDNPFRFDFILDQGDSPSFFKEGARGSLKQESTKLIKYFLASLTIPEKDLWVNLSPYEKNRIIPQSFGLTEMGRDLLAEDYMLKQITASLIYPEEETGKKFWNRIYEEAQKKFGTTNIPVNTFNKVWIVPDKAVVYENPEAQTAYVIESKLKVMLEQDYLSMEKHSGVNGEWLIINSQKQNKNASNTTPINNSPLTINQLASHILREIVIPELTKEVNTGQNFAQLRQVYNSLILATWYKKKIKDSILEQVYADKNKTVGVQYASSVIPAKSGIQNRINSDMDPRFRGDGKNKNDKYDNKIDDTEAIYQRYLQAFKKGVYNYIQEEPDPVTQDNVPRKYFSGGFGFGNIDKNMAMTSDRANLPRGTGRVERIRVNIIPKSRVVAKIRGLTRDDKRGEYNPKSPGFKKWFSQYVKSIRNKFKYIEASHSLKGVSMLQDYLTLAKNKKTAKISKVIESARKKGKQIIVEIGSGNTVNALKIAQRNKQALVIATDEYDRNPQTALEYLPYAIDFDEGTLPAQKANLDNLIVVRSLADILLYLPDGSLDSIVFVQPSIAPLKDLVVLTKKFNILRKLKPGAEIAILAKNIDKELNLIADHLRFKKQANEIFMKVDLGKNSAWNKRIFKGRLYLAQKGNRAMKVEKISNSGELVELPSGMKVQRGLIDDVFDGVLDSPAHDQGQFKRVLKLVQQNLPWERPFRIRHRTAEGKIKPEVRAIVEAFLQVKEGLIVPVYPLEPSVTVVAVKTGNKNPLGTAFVGGEDEKFYYLLTSWRAISSSSGILRFGQGLTGKFVPIQMALNNNFEADHLIPGKVVTFNIKNDIALIKIPKIKIPNVKVARFKNKKETEQTRYFGSDPRLGGRINRTIQAISLGSPQINSEGEVVEMAGIDPDYGPPGSGDIIKTRKINVNVIVVFLEKKKVPGVQILNGNPAQSVNKKEEKGYVGLTSGNGKINFRAGEAERAMKIEAQKIISEWNKADDAHRWAMIPYQFLDEEFKPSHFSYSFQEFLMYALLDTDYLKRKRISELNNFSSLMVEGKQGKLKRRRLNPIIMPIDFLLKHLANPGISLTYGNPVFLKKGLSWSDEDVRRRAFRNKRLALLITLILTVSYPYKISKNTKSNKRQQNAMRRSLEAKRIIEKEIKQYAQELLNHMDEGFKELITASQKDPELSLLGDNQEISLGKVFFAEIVRYRWKTIVLRREDSYLKIHALLFAGFVFRADKIIKEAVEEVYRRTDALASKAMLVKRKQNMGGIDLTPANMNVQVKTGSPTEAFGDDKGMKGQSGKVGIRFHLSPAMLARLRDAPGFEPEIVDIQPMRDLRGFLTQRIK